MSDWGGSHPLLHRAVGLPSETAGSKAFGDARDPTRLVAFSDAVIAIAVTLLVLEIHPPDTHDIVHGLASLWPSYLAYLIWWYVRRHRRLLRADIDAVGVRSIGRRFQLALAWIAVGTVVGAFVPAVGVAVIAAFIPFYWLPITGEIAKVRRRRGRRGAA